MSSSMITTTLGVVWAAVGAAAGAAPPADDAWAPARAALSPTAGATSSAVRLSPIRSPRDVPRPEGATAALVDRSDEIGPPVPRSHHALVATEKQHMSPHSTQTDRKSVV